MARGKRELGVEHTEERKRVRGDEFSFRDATSLDKCEDQLLELTHQIKRHPELTTDTTFLANVNAAFLSLEHFLDDDDYRSWERKKGRHAAEKISYLLYNCGQLAETSTVRLSAKSLHFLIDRLKKQRYMETKFVGNGFYGLGLLACEKKLDGDMKVDDINAILQAIKSLPDLSLFSLSTSFYGLGFVAREGQLSGKIKAEMLTKLIETAIGLSKDVEPTQVSNIIYGLALMAMAGSLDDVIDANLLVRLLELVRKRADFDARMVGNSLWALGQMADKGYLQGHIDAGVWRYLLEILIKEGKGMDMHAISSGVNGLALLAASKHLQGNVEVDTLSPCLVVLGQRQHQQPPDNQQSRSISNILHGMGIMARAGQLHGLLEAHVAEMVLRVIEGYEEKDSRHVSNSFWGLGLMSKANHLNGVIDVGVVQQLLVSLSKLADLQSLGISNSFRALALMAKAGHLQGKIDAAILQVLLTSLLNSTDCPAKHITNSLNALGLLLESGHVNGMIDARIVRKLVKKLHELDGKVPQDYSLTYYSLGLMAKAGQLNDSITVDMEPSLLERFRRSEPAKAEQLNDATNMDTEPSLLENPRRTGPCIAQEIDNIFYGLGLIAEASLLDGTIDVSDVHHVLELLASCTDLSAKSISLSFYGIGRIAQAGQLVGQLEVNAVQRLLKKLQELDYTNPQDFSSACYGLGLSAKAGHLHGIIEADVIQGLLEKYRLHIKKASALEIVNGLYGLALMAEKGHLDAAIDEDFVSQSIDVLSSSADLNTHHVSLSLCCLGMLANAGKLDISNALATHVSGLLKASCIKNLNAEEARRALFGLVSFWPAVQCDPKTLKLIFDRAIRRSYIHPRNAAILIQYLVVFKTLHAELDSTFKALLPAITVSINQFPLHLQEQLRQTISELEDIPTWKNALEAQLEPRTRSIVVERESFEFETESFEGGAELQRHSSDRTTELSSGHSQPRRTDAPQARLQSTDPAWIHSYQNDFVFKAIADKNLVSLERLFHMRGRAAEELSAAVLNTEQHSRSRAVSHTSVPRERPDVSINNRATANSLTVKFLQQTEASALRRLIRKSTCIYFDLLLHACSRHTRYQLAISNALHPVILHLPLAELELMVKSFCQLELYRDHRALLSLVDALTIRLFEHPDIEDEQTTIPGFREELLNRAIDFHQDHNRVLPRLEAAKLLLASPTPTFLDNDDEPMIISDAGNPPVTQTTDASENKRTDVSSARASFFPTAGARPSGVRGNSHLKYEAEDIQAILFARTSKLPNVAILAAANMTKDYMGNRVVDVLRDHVETQRGIINLTSARSLIIPILIVDHWVGIRLVLGAEETRITFYNSSKNESSDRRLMANIIQEVKSVLYEGRRIFNQPMIRVHEKCLQQNDAVSCGPLFIENVYCHLKGAWYSTDTSIDTLTPAIRLRHLEVLQTHNPVYYQGFRQRQAGETGESTQRQGPK